MTAASRVWKTAKRANSTRTSPAGNQDIPGLVVLDWCCTENKGRMN